jgi:hypothetical protein
MQQGLRQGVSASARLDAVQVINITQNNTILMKGLFLSKNNNLVLKRYRGLIKFLE